MADPWWRNFFHGAAVDLWIAACTPERDRAEVDFIEQALRLKPGAQVLDVPCGHGRHSLELASRGYDITGVDLSTEFLAAARKGSAERGLQVRWEQRDMRDLPWPGRFDAAICCGNSFGYLEHAENVEFLQAVGRAMKPGARFLIDTGVIAESILPAFQPRRWYQVGDIHFLIENRYDAPASRLDTDYTFIRDGQVDKRTGTQQVYTLRELCALLADAGFDDHEAFSGTDRTAFVLGSPRLLLICRRR